MVIRRVAALRSSHTAHHVFHKASRIIKCYLVANAVVLCIRPRRCRARAARPSAVDILSCIVSRQCNYVIRCRVTNDRTTAPCGISHCPRVACPLKLIALIVDLGRSILVNNGFCLLVCLRYRTVVVADNDAIHILQQRPFAAWDILHIKHTKIVDLRPTRIRQCKQGGIPRHVFEIKIDLCKILNVVCRCACIDIERIPCCLILCVVTTSAAENLAGRNISNRTRLRIAEVDRVASGITMLRKTTVDKTAYSPPFDRDRVARRRAYSRRSITSVELTRRTARDGYLVALAIIALRHICRRAVALGIAAVNLSVPRHPCNGDMVARCRVAEHGFTAVHIDFTCARDTITRINCFLHPRKLVALINNRRILRRAMRHFTCNIRFKLIVECNHFVRSIVVDIDAIGVLHERHF